MIKINWNKKLSKIGLNKIQFEKKYTDKLLDYDHFTISSRTGRVPVLKDRFGLYDGKSQLELSNLKKTKNKLEDIFFWHYTNKVEMKRFIDHNFRVINNIQESRSLLHSILIMTPDDLHEKVNFLNVPAQVKRSLNIIFNYDRDRKCRIKYAFELLNFKVCIYCNRNYISNYSKNKVKTATFTLDHFHQKDKYPIFSLSLYNLIPSCSVCNTSIKNTQSLNHYNNPHSDSYNFHELARFKLQGSDSVKLISTNVECKKYIRDFKINEIYDIHSTEIKDIINRRRTFNDKQIKNLSEITKISPNKIKSILFGNVIFNQDLDQESLAKLKVDLAKELNLI